ncbi:MAG: efflux RND transporter periplasmic adaptor subunit, partial [Casimicrobiaceae bacterium]
MSAGNRIIAVIGVGLVAAAGFGLYSLGMNRGMQMGAGTVSSTQMTDQATGGKGAAAPADRKVLYWHDPMVPGQKFDKPGKSPFMDMQLVPVYAGIDGDESRVSISPRVQQNLGVRTVEVVRGALTPTLEVVGSVAYNDRDVALVQARTTGFIEKLSVRAPLDAVRRGQVLGEMVVPEWSAAQEEYLSARRIAGAAGGLPALA